MWELFIKAIWLSGTTIHCEFGFKKSHWIAGSCYVHSIGLEWKLSELGAVKTSLKKDPSAKKEIRDVLTASLQGTTAGYKDPDDSDED